VVSRIFSGKKTETGLIERLNNNDRNTESRTMDHGREVFSWIKTEIIIYTRVHTNLKALTIGRRRYYKNPAFAIGGFWGRISMLALTHSTIEKILQLRPSQQRV